MAFKICKAFDILINRCPQMSARHTEKLKCRTKRMGENEAGKTCGNSLMNTNTAMSSSLVLKLCKLRRDKV